MSSLALLALRYGFKLFAGRSGGWVIMGLAAAALLAVVYLKGKEAARQEQELAAARAAISVLENENARNAAAGEAAARKAVERGEKASALEETVASYQQELEQRGRVGATAQRQQNERIEDYEERLRLAARGCLLDGRDIERLRRIR